MPTAPATSYDRVPYKSHPFRQSHPDRLAVIATLHGMSPPPIERARVLELGCASGGNLLPIADQFPEGMFLGLDLSSRQIQDGQRLIERAGLKNVELRHQDILAFDAPPESFDDILCHGVFSWVICASFWQRGPCVERGMSWEYAARAPGTCLRWHGWCPVG